MPRHRLVDGEFLQHVVVVLAEERLHALRRPVRRRRRDVEEGLAVLLQRSRRIARGHGDAAIELRHGRDLNRLRRHGDEVLLADERRRRPPSVLLRQRDHRLVRRMLVGEFVEHRLDAPCDDRHPRSRRASAPSRYIAVLRRLQLRLGVGEDLFLRQVGVERIAQLAAELFVAGAEVAVRPRQEVFLQPRAVVRERVDAARFCAAFTSASSSGACFASSATSLLTSAIVPLFWLIAVSTWIFGGFFRFAFAAATTSGT